MPKKNYKLERNCVTFAAWGVPQCPWNGQDCIWPQKQWGEEEEEEESGQGKNKLVMSVESQGSAWSFGQKEKVLSGHWFIKEEGELQAI